MTDARLEAAVAETAKAMKAHPNWSKPGYVVTHDEIEADRHAHALLEAVEYFKERDPNRIEALLQEGVRD
jgi:hypothetical protein